MSRSYSLDCPECGKISHVTLKKALTLDEVKKVKRKLWVKIIFNLKTWYIFGIVCGVLGTQAVTGNLL